MEHSSKVSPDFLDKVTLLGRGFPAAGRWLTDLANDRVEGFWLSTAQNAHLYYRDGFYIYIKPSKLSIELHSTYNAHIHKDTTDKHHLLFVGPLKKLVADLGGFRDGWASGLGDGYTLKSTTPPTLFDDLLALIREVHE